jgi:hypothetical protein
MIETTKLAVIEEELHKIEAPAKIPCGFKDCYCFINETDKFCSAECERSEREQPKGVHGNCSCDHGDCVMIPERDSASIFAQKSLMN